MSLFEDTNPRDLKELLRQISSREAALPDFQRDFVWDPGATRDLIVSIAKNYPAGSLLRIRNTHDLFASREFEGAPKLDGHHATYLVLDGQQRLTSLYQAFYGVGDHRYFVNLKRLIDGGDFDDAIFHERANSKRFQRLDSLEVQASEFILPLLVLSEGAGGFTRWALRAAQAGGKSEQQRIGLQDLLIKVADDWIRTIDDYRFPVVTLSDETDAEAVCTIFETLNRTGVKLSAFELLTARFWPQSVNLRQLWEDAKKAHPIIEDFDVDPYYILQVVALLAKDPPSCKRGDVLNLTVSDVEKWWVVAARGMAGGLEILRDEAGVLVPRWLPYTPMLISLAATLGRQLQASHVGEGARRHQILRWFWCAALGQMYEGAVNSQVSKDFAELTRWLDGGEPPDSVSSFRFDPQILRDTTPRQRALYRAVMCLVVRRQTRDFHTGGFLTGDLVVEQNVDDHHIFPQAYLKSSVSSRLRDSILNRTLIDRKTNILISDKAPSVYFEEIRRTYEGDSSLGAVKFAEVVESHLLPAESDGALWRDDFEAFLAWRQDALWRAVMDVTGVTVAADLMEQPSP